MWQLVINGPGYFDTTYDLPEGATGLGRGDQNDIVLSGDLVSRRHARVHVRGEQLSLEDLGSRNGTKLNGHPLVGVMPLKVGDTVQVGENSLVVRSPAPEEVNRGSQMDLVASGVRRYGKGRDVEAAVMLAKNVRDSSVVRVLDNVSASPLAALPFSDAAPMERPTQASTPIAYDSLLLLYKVAELLASSEEVQGYLDETIDRLMVHAGATTAVLLLRQQGAELAPAAVRHRGQLAQGEVPVSDAVVEAALAKGAALAVSNARDDERFSKRESVALYQVDQVLCVPVGKAAPFLGVLYLNMPSSAPGQLEGLLDLSTAVAQLIASGVERFRAKEMTPAEQRLRKTLERFHAPHIAEQRAAEMRRSSGSLARLEPCIGTVLFADIAGFTELTEKLPPERVVELLGEFYQRMSRLIFSFEGTVDKFMGDAVMALFGAPYGKGDDAVRALRTALALREEWKKAMMVRPIQERTELKIGVNTGKLLAGTVGSEARLDFTAVGETVNLASFLVAEADPGQILITAKTLSAVHSRFDVKALGERTLFATGRKLPLFEVIDEDPGMSTHPGV